MTFDALQFKVVILKSMARANRHHLPGHVRHITHRCHKKEFLLKFDKDKKLWINWLLEAKKRIQYNDNSIQSKQSTATKEGKGDGFVICFAEGKYIILRVVHVRNSTNTCSGLSKPWHSLLSACEALSGNSGA